MVSLPSLVWTELDLEPMSEFSPLSGIDELSLPSCSFDELNLLEEEEIIDFFALPAPALVSPVIKERSIAISRKRTRSESPPQSPTDSIVSAFSGRSSSINSNGSHESIVKSLDSCGGVLKRMRTKKKWCEAHCSAQRQLCKDSPVRRPGVVIYVFK